MRLFWIFDLKISFISTKKKIANIYFVTLEFKMKSCDVISKRKFTSYKRSSKSNFLFDVNSPKLEFMFSFSPFSFCIPQIGILANCSCITSCSEPHIIRATTLNKLKPKQEMFGSKSKNKNYGHANNDSSEWTIFNGCSVCNKRKIEARE